MNTPHRAPARRPRNRSASLAGLAALLLLSLGAACAADPGAAVTRAEATLAEIRALVGDAACDSDAVCRSMPIGAKACGGPEAYIAWSSQRSDPAQLAAAVAAYTERRLADNARSGRISNCAMVTDPGAACLPTGAAGGPARSCQSLAGRGGSQAR